MFCGLPIIVAAEPALVAVASAIANGRGVETAALRAGINSGAIVMIRISLANTAERPPPTTTVSANKLAVPRRVLMNVPAACAGDCACAEIDKAPIPQNWAEMIIIAKRTSRHRRHIDALPNSSSVIFDYSASKR